MEATALDPPSYSPQQAMADLPAPQDGELCLAFHSLAEVPGETPGRSPNRRDTQFPDASLQLWRHVFPSSEELARKEGPFVYTLNLTETGVR